MTKHRGKFQIFIPVAYDVGWTRVIEARKGTTIILCRLSVVCTKLLLLLLRAS